MSNTIYATFTDAALAERAAGALLDHGVQSEHLSLVRQHDGTVTTDTIDADTTAGSTPYTSGAVIGGPGSVNAMGSGIQPAGTQTSMDSPSSTGFGNAPSPGYDDVEVNAAERGQGYVGDADNTTDDALGSMRDSELNRTYGESSVPVSTGGIDTTPSSVEGAYETGNRDNGISDPSDVAKKGITTTTAADAGAGAIKGAGIGAGVGVIAAIASLLVPGIGLVVGGGALAIALGGLAATAGAGAAAGAVYGYLKDQGVEEHLAKQYSDTLGNGGALLAVQYPSGNVDEPEIRMVLDKYGASSVGLTGRQGYVA